MNRSPLPRATPASRGVDAAGIAGFLRTVAAQGLELHSLMLYRAGAVVAEGWWRPYAPGRPHMLHSATKSWTGVAVGLAIAEGRLALTDRVVDFYPEHLPPDVSENLAAMTVADLLTMRSGHRTGSSGGEWRRMGGSWIAAFLREEVADQPGEHFIYSSGSSYMLSAIVTKVTGERVSDYLTRRVFAPLGLGAMLWDVSPEGINPGGNGLSCTTEDFLKLGVLHLHGGAWEGRQLLPADWVKDATRNHVAEVWMGAFDGRSYAARDAANPAERREGYGYQWWMTRDGGYRASGVFGQQCIVLPRQEAVIAVTAGLAVREPRLMEAVWAHLVPALGAPVATEDPSLAPGLAALALPLPAGVAQSPLAIAVSGRRYVMAPNEDQVAEVVLDFVGDACTFTLRDHRGTHRVRAGLGHEIEGETTMTGDLLHHAYQPPSLRVVASGAWATPEAFHMHWRFVETAFCDTVTCRFGAGTLRLEHRVNTNGGALERPDIEGRAA